MNTPYYSYYPNNISYRGTSNDRSLLLPILFGAAVGFPFGYIASNTNKCNNNYPCYPMMPPQPYIPYQYGYGYVGQGPFIYR